jgi:hypothetical protein
MAVRPLMNLWFAALLLIAPAVGLARPMLVLDRGQDSVELTPFLGVMHDASGQAGIDDAMAGDANGHFDSLDTTALGFREGAFWFHAGIVNRRPMEPRWLLVQRYALSDRIDVYLRHPDGRIEHQAGGDSRPFAARSIPYRHPNFWLLLPYDTRVDLYVRIRSDSSMQVPLWLHTPSAFTELSRDAQLGIGIYYGILFALLVYNLVLWVSLRDATYFWYVFHIAAFGMVLFTLNGLGFEYLWPRSTWLAQKAVPLFICLALLGMQQFARAFLDLRRATA